jgi:predicted Fe-Mo cluster-binding NifX family protein
MRLADEAIEEQRVLANPFREEEKAKGIRVAEWLVALKADAVVVRESLRGKGPVYVFGDAGVELQETEATTLSQAMAEAAAQAVE